jgi:hypothetical protein
MKIAPDFIASPRYPKLILRKEAVEVLDYKKIGQKIFKNPLPLRVEYGARTHDLLNHNQAL